MNSVDRNEFVCGRKQVCNDPVEFFTSRSVFIKLCCNGVRSKDEMLSCIINHLSLTARQL